MNTQVKLKRRLSYVLISSFAISPALAENQTVDSHIGKLEFTHNFANGYPTRDTVEKLYDERELPAPARRTSGRYLRYRSRNGSTVRRRSARATATSPRSLVTTTASVSSRPTRRHRIISFSSTYLPARSSSTCRPTCAGQSVTLGNMHCRIRTGRPSISWSARGKRRLPVLRDSKSGARRRLT
jgi:hypothetical protein